MSYWPESGGEPQSNHPEREEFSPEGLARHPESQVGRLVSQVMSQIFVNLPAANVRFDTI